MSDFHDYKKIESMDFNCAVDSRKEVVIQLPKDTHDTQQEVCIVVITNEGVILDFYEDGELISTVARTYDEWLNSDTDKNELALNKSKSEHPTNWKANKENSL